MALRQREETIAMPDGGQMGAHVCLPEAGEGAGILVLMEIFGVGPYIKRATGRLAELGYVAIAPDIYRRIEPGLVIDHDEAGLQRALEAVGRLDHQGAVEDACTALEALRSMPETGGRKVGVLGFCLGGTHAFHVAAAADPTVAVCYYGSGIADSLQAADRIECPVLFHFGGEDAFIPVQDAQRVCELAGRHPGWECHIQPDGGHAFDNHVSPMFHRPGPAARAWELTRQFLARELAAQ